MLPNMRFSSDAITSRSVSRITRTFCRAIDRLILSLLLLIILLLSSGCYSKSPIYTSSESAGTNTEMTYTGPAYEEKMNVLGWGWLLSATAGGAYGGYATHLKLEWEEDAPKTEIAGFNAAVGGLLGLTVAVITKNLLRPDPPVVTRENAGEWVEDLDERYLLLRTPDTEPLDQLVVIARDVEPGFRSRSLTDVKTFLTAFPLSERTGDIFLETVPAIRKNELIQLYNLTTDSTVQQNIGLAFLDSCSTILEMKRAGEDFPRVADQATARGVSLVKDITTAEQFREVFKTIEPITPTLHRLATSTTRNELGVILATFPELEGIDSLKRSYALSASSVADIRYVAEKYPEYLPSLESKLASLAQDESGWEEYLKLFPEGEQAGRFRLMLEEATRPPERLSSNINTGAAEYAPVISPDGNTLYFVRRYDRRNIGGVFSEDIWYSELQDRGTWSLAKQMGSGLNRRCCMNRPPAPRAITQSCVVVRRSTLHRNSRACRVRSCG